MKIKNTIIAALFLSSTLTLTNCEAVQNSNNQQKGTAIGAASGAVLGAVLGNNLGKGGNGELGAVLGGIIGGVAGNVIGNRMDKQAKEIKQTLPGAEVERVGDGIKITLPESLVNFAFNSSDLAVQGKQQLDKLATILENNPDTNINIYGYTDSKGTDEYNQNLSEKRANAVKAYLTSHKVASNRMFPMGMGEASPIDTNDTDAGRAKNRRVEFAITANEKMIEDAQKN